MPRRSRWWGPMAAALILADPGAARPGHGDAFEPTERYESRSIEGWTVLVHRGFLGADPKLAEQALTLLRVQLDRIARRVPGRALEQLRGVRIWVEEREPHHPCMAYHPDAGWLREHGMNPEKARCVEIANARNFLTWTLQQPWMVLHELAHAYHHQFLEGGFENRPLSEAHRKAREGGTYDEVAHVDGRRHRAYALNNPMEYFAECSEAYFGANDFYPFVRPELREHDPEAFELLRRVWEGDDGPKS